MSSEHFHASVSQRRRSGSQPSRLNQDDTKALSACVAGHGGHKRYAAGGTARPEHTQNCVSVETGARRFNAPQLRPHFPPVHRAKIPTPVLFAPQIRSRPGVHFHTCFAAPGRPDSGIVSCS